MMPENLLSAIIIQARMSSCRFPGKTMSLLGGMPLIEYVYRRCGACAASNIVVATSVDISDDVVYNYCRVSKIPVFRGSMHNVLERYILAADSVNAKYIVRVCADTPFVDIVLIETLLRTLIKDRLDYASPDRRTCASGFYSEAINVDALKRAAAATKDTEDLEHVTKYITSNPGKFSTKYIDAGLNSGLIRNTRLTVDYPEDIRTANIIAAALDGRFSFTSEDVLNIVCKELYGKNICAE